MAERVTNFVKEHYPAPVPDCIRVHDMLHSKFTWTEAEYKRAVAFKAQGLTCKEVARRLSPTLRCTSTANALKRYSSPKPVRELISVDELQEISKLVDKYSEKYPVVEIVDRICTQLSLGNRSGYHRLISLRIVAHPHYQAKLRDIEYSDLVNCIAMSWTTTKLAAKKLNVPYHALDNRLRDLNSKLYSSKWTEEETRKLLDYMRTVTSFIRCIIRIELDGTHQST
ncbi:hypothetical protein GGH94_005660 [Coemansia aciculifera]|uniref:Uncharacterized protein n=1 Tax=Coemansia aciculifera TaxID=417176 RepID=A0A9W8ID40_9FUNG|nr:hypothetical protein GGH94_005660 [Coemansia aciculifera]KAJ2870419.1 hypothetical protein GGH93_005590 [Coemansia aciculifera]